MLRASKKKSEMNIEKDLGLLSKKRIELNLISDRVDSLSLLFFFIFFLFFFKLTPAHLSLFYRYFNYHSQIHSAVVAKEQTTSL